MYSINSVLTVAAQLPSMNKAAQKNRQARTGVSLFSALVFSCFFILAATSAKAQQNNTINTVAGGASFNNTATLASIPGPNSVAEDANGNIYIASPYSYSVLQVNPSTNTLTVFAGIGIYGYSGDGGPANQAALSSPSAVAVDLTTGTPTSGDVYIADGNRIRVVTPNGDINTFANSSGAACGQHDTACGDGGPASKAQLSGPQGLYVDSSGNLFIADTGDNKIRKISGGIITTVAGYGLTCDGPTSACGDGGSATASAAELDLPIGVVTDSNGNIYIGDTRDQRIRCVANLVNGCANTKYPTTVVGEIVTYAGSGIFCTDPTGPCGDGSTLVKARFHNPAGLAVDSTGDLYVADEWDYEIREATSGASATVKTYAGTGVQGYAGDGGRLIYAEFDDPLSIVLSSNGDIVVADTGNARVRQITPATSKTYAMINTVAGGGSVGDSGPASSASLAGPVTIAWDTSGTNYYIADSANNRIREVSAGTISTVAGTGQTGYLGDNGSAISAFLDTPNSVAVDAAGNIYLADLGNSVVREVNAGSGNITTIAGSGSSCEDPTNPCGDGGPAIDANISYPSSIAVDGNGNLYIADYYSHRIRVVNLSTGIIETAAGTGAAGHTGDGGPAVAATLNRPYGIAVDRAGDLYIADSSNNKVRCVVEVAGGCNGSAYAVGTIFTYAFNGLAKFGGDGGPATSASMQDPLEVSVDPAGNVFVGGGIDLLVQRIDALSKTVITVAGNSKEPGNAGFAGDGGASTLATLDNVGLAVNGAGTLLIADQGNNRIRQVDLVAVPVLETKKLSFPNTTVGQTSAPLAASIANSGLADLPITKVAIGGTDPGDFAISQNTCVSQIAPQFTCSVSVTFTPTKTGARSATLTITSSLGTGTIALVGTGQ